MQVPDEVRKCVVFLGYRKASSILLGGTGFLVLVPIAGTTLLGGYLVTAKHVIDDIKKAMPIDGKILLRLNAKAGAVLQETDFSDWIEHPASTADVAILPIGLKGDWDHGFIPIAIAVNADVIRERQISLGDEVFLTGLFIPHYGVNRNIPIIRVGNIACMPEEPVKTKDYGLIDAYLIEARSVGGLSGSPVFVVTGGMARRIGQWIADHRSRQLWDKPMTVPVPKCQRMPAQMPLRLRVNPLEMGSINDVVDGRRAPSRS
jgi:hypothetical protein